MTLIVRLDGAQNVTFPSIIAAAMCYDRARAFRCDRIRVEKNDGARIEEYPIGVVGRFLSRYGITRQPERAAVQGRDWETHRPVWPGVERPPAA